ncbi:MAG: ATP-binding cassette domain-containing protein [Bacteroidales bacterium]|nr:ATP-binding cassette domain-containing protein [Bacteroidales bacterium]
MIVVRDAVPIYQERQFRRPINIKIAEGESVAIVGANGSGKSTLVDIMLGEVPLRSGHAFVSINGLRMPRMKIAYVSFRNIYDMTSNSVSYYQQRWNTTETDDSKFVSDILKMQPDEVENCKYAEFGLREIIDKRLINLSSGELRKVMLIKHLLQNPRLLIIDNPYIGLDADSRDKVDELLRSLAKDSNIQVILVLADHREIPSWIETIIATKDMNVLGTYENDAFINNNKLVEMVFPDFCDCEVKTLPQPLSSADTANYEKVVQLNNVNVSYFGHKILENVNWTIKRGEKWALLGPNGSGKSTLLSLICGDNPQSYANDITLFDCKRGSGESIWDIKHRIGYISPDLHTYYRDDIDCLSVAASGFFDTIGLNHVPQREQLEIARKWLKAFHCEYLAERSFLKISYGEQRIVLLARVFVKQPQLVILDEPMHGVDVGKKRVVENIIEHYCKAADVTLIFVSHYAEEIPQCITQEKHLGK